MRDRPLPCPGLNLSVAVLQVGPGRTRLLYRMSMDFMAWSKYIPGITHFWRTIANQVGLADLSYYCFGSSRTF